MCLLQVLTNIGTRHLSNELFSVCPLVFSSRFRKRYCLDHLAPLKKIFCWEKRSENAPVSLRNYITTLLHNVHCFHTLNGVSLHQLHVWPDRLHVLWVGNVLLKKCVFNVCKVFIFHQVPEVWQEAAGAAGGEGGGEGGARDEEAPSGTRNKIIQCYHPVMRKKIKTIFCNLRIKFFI